MIYYNDIIMFFIFIFISHYQANILLLLILSILLSLLSLRCCLRIAATDAEQGCNTLDTTITGIMVMIARPRYLWNYEHVKKYHKMTHNTWCVRNADGKHFLKNLHN